MSKKLDREISEASTLILVETLERIKEQEHLTNKGVMDYLDSKGTTHLLNNTEFLFGGIYESEDETLRILKGELLWK